MEPLLSPKFWQALRAVRDMGRQPAATNDAPSAPAESPPPVFHPICGPEGERRKPR